MMGVLIQSIAAQVPEGYYNSAAGLTGPALKAALHNIIDDHAELDYDETTMVLESLDVDTLNPNNVTCIYTGWSIPKNAYATGNDGWNKEHVWARSHGDFGFTPPEGSDLFNLFPCDATVNSAKGNRDFDEGNVEYLDAGVPTGCYTADYTWEPRGAMKGDVARAMFYMAVRYEGDTGELDLELVDYVNSSPNGEPLHGNLETMLQWHQEDPVDNYERRRNDSIYYLYQDNRNPFIDHPEYVEQIWSGQPADHVTDFDADVITLTWTNSTGDILPDFYLIRRSTVGFEAIQAPADGILVPDGIHDKNVSYSAQRCVFNEVASNTTYYFKIYPYTVAGSNVNYKTDGEVQQVEIQAY